MKKINIKKIMKSLRRINIKNIKKDFKNQKAPLYISLISAFLVFSILITSFIYPNFLKTRGVENLEWLQTTFAEFTSNWNSSPDFNIDILNNNGGEFALTTGGNPYTSGVMRSTVFDAGADISSLDKIYWNADISNSDRMQYDSLFPTDITNPSALAINTSNNYIYIGDGVNRKIKIYESPSYNFIDEIDLSFAPEKIRIDSKDNYLYINRGYDIYIYDDSYNYVSDFSVASGYINDFDIDNGYVYILDRSNSKVSRYEASSGLLDGECGGFGGGQLEFDQPNSINFENGRLYVSDTGNNRVQIVDIGPGYCTYDGEINSYYGISHYLYNQSGILYQVDGNGYLIEDGGNISSVRVAETGWDVEDIVFDSDDNAYLNINGSIKKYSKQNAPVGTVKFQIATSDDNISWSDPLGPDGTVLSYYETSGGSINLPAKRYIQWVAYLESFMAGESPIIEDVKITYSVSSTPPSGTSFPICTDQSNPPPSPVSCLFGGGSAVNSSNNKIEVVPNYDFVDFMSGGFPTPYDNIYNNLILEEDVSTGGFQLEAGTISVHSISLDGNTSPINFYPGVKLQITLRFPYTSPISSIEVCQDINHDNIFNCPSPDKKFELGSPDVINITNTSITFEVTSLSNFSVIKKSSSPTYSTPSEEPREEVIEEEVEEIKEEIVLPENNTVVVGNSLETIQLSPIPPFNPTWGVGYPGGRVKWALKHRENIYYLYVNLLKRRPSSSEVNWWLKYNDNINLIRYLFLTSEEYRNM